MEKFTRYSKLVANGDIKYNYSKDDLRKIQILLNRKYNSQRIAQNRLNRPLPYTVRQYMKHFLNDEKFNEIYEEWKYIKFRPGFTPTIIKRCTDMPFNLENLMAIKKCEYGIYKSKTKDPGYEAKYMKSYIKNNREKIFMTPLAAKISKVSMKNLKKYSQKLNIPQETIVRKAISRYLYLLSVGMKKISMVGGNMINNMINVTKVEIYDYKNKPVGFVTKLDLIFRPDNHFILCKMQISGHRARKYSARKITKYRGNLRVYLTDELVSLNKRKLKYRTWGEIKSELHRDR